MFQIRNFESKTLSWWYDQKDKIDFNPSYQRKGRLWSTKDKSYLIDSVLNGFDMPKIYLADFTFFASTLNEKKMAYAVIDGKQRLEALFDFIEGNLTLDKNFIYLEDFSLKIGGLGYNDLKAGYPKIASKFDNFNLSVITIITDTESMINEMFIRLNKSKPLTGAELRNAMKGEVPKLTRHITEHKFFKENVKFNIQRGGDSNVATKLLLIEFRGKFVDTKKINLDKLVDEAVAAETPNLSNSYEIIKRVLDKMSISFTKKDILLASSGLIPVFYWFFKNHSEENSLREFINSFEANRKVVKGLNDLSKINDEDLIKLNNMSNDDITTYLRFDFFTKSLNDQASLIGCYNILEEKFSLWKRLSNNS